MYPNVQHCAFKIDKNPKYIQVLTAGSLRALRLHRLLNRPRHDKHHFTCPLCPLYLTPPKRPQTVIVSCETIRAGRGHQAHCQSTISSHWRSPLVANSIRQELSLAVLSLPSISQADIVSPSHLRNTLAADSIHFGSNHVGSIN